MEKLITMSHAELNRQSVMLKIEQKKISQTKAALVLNLSLRQLQRIYARYKVEGPEGLVSRKRGKKPNNTTPDNIKQNVINIIREKYPDFGPTFAAEKIDEIHGIYFCKETVRKWMIEANLWMPRDQRRKRAYQPRNRRECYGELIQIDGSDHAWFENRSPKCTLLVYIDDATSKLLHLQFVLSESTFTYFDATKRYIELHGKPVAFYSDKHSTFRTNKRGDLNGDGVTQFGRALTNLNVDIICANSSQAKGRVERANRTLQDRLIKEMRLLNISSMDAGNKYLPEFIEDFNSRFSKPPINNKNIHRELLEHEILDEIFCWQEPRTLSTSLTVQYDKVVYLIKDSVQTRKLSRKRVMVHELMDGTIKIKYEGEDLPYSVFDTLHRVNQGEVVNNKRLGSALKLIKEKQDARDEKRSSSCPSRVHLGMASTTELRNSTVYSRKRKTA